MDAENNQYTRIEPVRNGRIDIGDTTYTILNGSIVGGGVNEAMHIFVAGALLNMQHVVDPQGQHKYLKYKNKYIKLKNKLLSRSNR